MISRLVAAFTVLALAACSLPERSRNGGDQVFAEPVGRETLIQFGEEPPFTQTELTCLRHIFGEVGARQVTFIGPVQNDAVHPGGQLQVTYRRDLKGFLIALGLRPVEYDVTKVDIVVAGALTGFARLTRVDERSQDFSILLRAFDLQPNRSTVMREGNVTFRATIDIPYERDGQLVYGGYATGTATVRYYSKQTEGRITGTVVAVSGGFSRKRVAVVDAQQSASLAMKVATVTALMRYLEAKGVTKLADGARGCLADF